MKVKISSMPRPNQMIMQWKIENRALFEVNLVFSAIGLAQFMHRRPISHTRKSYFM